MNRHGHIPRASTLAVILALGMVSAVGGQVVLLNGPVYDGLNGPLMDGVVYHATGNIHVPPNQTLSVYGNAIVKFADGASLTVQGRLMVAGSSSGSARFTSFSDDTAGGDTNGDGPSSGHPGQWAGLAFAGTSDGSVLWNFIVDYAGYNFHPGVFLDDADVSLSSMVIRNCYSTALSLNHNTVRANVSGALFQNNGGVAIDAVPLEAVARMSVNSATGNAGNFVRVTTASLGGDLLLRDTNAIGSALVIATNVSVPDGVTLQVEGRLVFKAQVPVVYGIAGRLDAWGPVFTSFSDDEFGGDTDGNGPSQGSPGSWFGFQFSPTSGESRLRDVFVRHAGYNFSPGILAQAAPIQLERVVVERCYAAGLSLAHNTIGAQVRYCEFRWNGGVGITDVPIDAVPGFFLNTVKYNGGDYLQVTTATVGHSLRIDAPMVPDGVMVLSANLSIPAGVDLSFGPGVVTKFSVPAVVGIGGRLLTEGTESSPVVFTVFADDAYGGDTNRNGASSGSPGSWFGLSFAPSATGSILSSTFVRYAGYNFHPGIHLVSTAVTLDRARVQFAYASGLHLDHSTVASTIRNCRIENCGGVAIEAVRLDAVPTFRDNVAVGNAGDYLRVSVGAIGRTTEIGPESLPGGVLVLSDNVSVPVGSTLAFDAGLVVKATTTLVFNVAGGRFDVRGTAREPVVATVFADDTYGGDTDKNGPTLGSPGSWFGMQWTGSAVGDVEHLRVRYAGYNFAATVYVQTPGVRLRAVRADFGYGQGLVLDRCAGDPTDLVAFGCGGAGIVLADRDHDVIHATSAMNGGFGFLRGPSSTGLVVNSIAWGNAPGNFSGFTAGSVLASDGDPALAGAYGNLNLDPRFVDASAAVGNLRLRADSPCLGAADFAAAFATVFDADDGSRILDHALSGSMLPDMGAFERAAFSMQVSGVARQGETLTCTVSGPAGVSLFGVGAMDGVTLVPPLGFLTVGRLETLVVYPVPIPVGTPLPLRLPNDPSLVGRTLALQSLSVEPTGLYGNFTELIRLRVRG